MMSMNDHIDLIRLFGSLDYTVLEYSTQRQNGIQVLDQIVDRITQEPRGQR